MTFTVAKSHKQKAELAERILNSAGPVSVEVKDLGRRSTLQNASLHLLCQQLADELNAAGLDVRKTLRQDVEIPWTKDSVKELIWRPIMKAMTGNQSTIKLNRVQPSDIYHVLMRHMSEKHGIYLPWPSVETMNAEEKDQAG